MLALFEEFENALVAPRFVLEKMEKHLIPERKRQRIRRRFLIRR
jgi:hypothetical protein